MNPPSAADAQRTADDVQDSRAVRTLARAGFAANGLVHLVIGVIALQVARGGGSSSSASSEGASAQVLAAPGGVALLVIAGLAVLAVGGVFVYREASRRFLENVAKPAGAAGTVVTGLGIVGSIAKGVVLAVLGVLLIVAAVSHDPEQTGGIDEALRSLVGLPAGVFLLGVVAVGLIAYGLFCFARARWPRL
ncbi:DUF1206 domain-containing protein [Rathayibacter tritici]|uniref:DUF1206 domain-containing protein n=1 Tax=Rathayibacter tritici TaxID=33888 RepID=UPI002013692E|nr:DUF1206 domain-containing protein [Rathayibacter tritici]